VLTGGKTKKQNFFISVAIIQANYT